ncbi:MAG: Hsp70 family protein [Bacteroidia bacterium]|nr:Hsp70 family protein [Bacteroidia bacterium]
MINVGIDLGTTQSAIARYEKGRITLYRNPVTHRDTLPSVVGVREGRILTGEKAQALLQRYPASVAGGFKRKMGTDAVYTLEDQTFTPQELSACILRELRTFIQTGEQPEAAVITIPASFDTIQSNATREAGRLAGFQQVVLLQEPVAASLAFANQVRADAFEEGQWLVYDLGGGTFDVALVSIQEGEMQVLDHEGDNFLGGQDIDKALVEQLVIPRMEAEGEFFHLEREMKSASGRYHTHYQQLVRLAEAAKMELSVHEETTIEYEITDEAQVIHTFHIPVTRAALESAAEPLVTRTVRLIRDMLSRNQLGLADIKFVLMVGGSTYMPYVRRETGRQLGIPVHTGIDPVTAVAVGAAYYAATRPLTQAAAPDVPASRLQVRAAWQKSTRELKEYFTARFTGSLQGLQYRIVRADGGFDTGLLLLEGQIKAFLPLLRDTYNEFVLTVYEADGTPVPTALGPIGINQGRYNLAGQPLPQDLCLEVDDLEAQGTHLEVVFPKNSVLPLRTTLVRQATRTVSRGSASRLSINIVEGPGTSLPAAGLTIGFISIPGQALTSDLIRGSDVEIVLELSESRDLTIRATLLVTGQVFEQVFTPRERHVNLIRLRDEVQLLSIRLQTEIREAEDREDFEGARLLTDLEYELLELTDQARQTADDDATEARYQLDDQKRRLARRIDELTRDKTLNQVKADYFAAKRNMERVLQLYEPTPEHQTAWQTLLADEKQVLISQSPLHIREYIQAVNKLAWQVKWNSFPFLESLFWSIRFGQYGELSPPDTLDQLTQQGQAAIEARQIMQLKITINQLCELLPPSRPSPLAPGSTGIA